MNKNFSRLLATAFPLLSGCVDKVLLADKRDGGASDAPVHDDGPILDAPAPAVCAACGGPTGLDCLYAPGCGSVVRVCAVNTCADAIALQYCGCDGQTFVSGCLTPDRPFLHTGGCTTDADGGPTPVDDVVLAAPYCAAEDYYPRAVVQPPPDTGVLFPFGGPFEVQGRWIAPRRLATPLTVDCAAPVAGDPACHPDAVIRVQPDGDAGMPVEWLTSVAFESLPSVAVGTEVVLRLQAEGGPVAIPRPGNVTLILRRAGDQAVLMVVANTVRDARYNGAAPFPLGNIGVQRAAKPACVDDGAPRCGLTDGAFGMDVSGVTGGRAVQPRETAVFGGASGRYSFHNLVFTHAVGTFAPECAAEAGADTGLADFYGFEIVRQPDL